MGADVLRRNIVHDSTFVLRMNSSVENTPTTQSRGTLAVSVKTIPIKIDRREKTYNPNLLYCNCLAHKRTFL